MTDPALDPGAVPAVDAPSAARARQGPLAIWIRRLPRAVYVGIGLAAVVVLLLIAVVLNPGERVGPVRPANPPVGGPDLPAARL